MEQPSSERIEARPLVEVRDRLQRRRALQRNLGAQAAALATEIEDLRVRHDRTSALLQAERQQARVLEQRLDRLVPRLLARLAEAQERRAQAARALAELVSERRNPSLDPVRRARMAALGPLMLNRLRNVELAVSSLRQRPEQAIERHRRIERRLPGLTTARARLRGELEQGRQRQLAMRDRLRALAMEVKVLGEEQVQLAGSLLHGELALALRAGSRSDRQALAEPAGTLVSSASVRKGAIGSTARVALDAAARDSATSRLVAAAPEPGTGDHPIALAADAGWSVMPAAPGYPVMAALPSQRMPAPPSASYDALSRAGALDPAVRPDGGSGPGSARMRGQWARPPILPVPDAAPGQRVIATGRPELAIAAVPGQGVAAPAQGKVAFAGPFKSYGLLLILEHEREYHTLLWGFARLDVERGDQVQVGQIVGIMDARGGDPPVLHVERRRRGRPIDLAASSNGIQG